MYLVTIISPPWPCNEFYLPISYLFGVYLMSRTITIPLKHVRFVYTGIKKAALKLDFGHKYIAFGHFNKII